MKRVLLLCTGGTIACQNSDTGRTPQRSGESLLAAARIPPDTAVEVREPMRLDSTDLCDDDRLRLARLLWSERENYDGFVVTHGSDTMAYTAAFLYRVLPRFPRPIILTGAQLPMETVGSDGPRNLSDALTCAVSGYRGAAICFAGKLRRGCRVSKRDAWDMDAFDDGGSGYEPDGVIENGTLHMLSCPEAGEGSWREPVFPRAAVLTVTPLLSAERMAQCAGLDVLLLYGYGAGGVPEELAPAVEQVVRSGTRVYLGTQCPHGDAKLDVYAVGQRMLALGVRPLARCTLEDASARVQCGLL